MAQSICWCFFSTSEVEGQDKLRICLTSGHWDTVVSKLSYVVCMPSSGGSYPVLSFLNSFGCLHRDLIVRTACDVARLDHNQAPCPYTIGQITSRCLVLPADIPELRMSTIARMNDALNSRGGVLALYLWTCQLLWWSSSGRLTLYKSSPFSVRLPSGVSSTSVAWWTWSCRTAIRECASRFMISFTVLCWLSIKMNLHDLAGHMSSKSNASEMKTPAERLWNKRRNTISSFAPLSVIITSTTIHRTDKSLSMSLDRGSLVSVSMQNCYSYNILLAGS